MASPTRSSKSKAQRTTTAEGAGRDVEPQASEPSADSSSSLTPRQQQVLDIITASIRHTSVFPSLRAIARQLGVKSPSGVAGHLKALAAKGYLSRTPLQTSGFALSSSAALASRPSPHPSSSELSSEEGGTGDGPGQHPHQHAHQHGGFPLVAQIAAGSPHISVDHGGMPDETLFFSYDYFGGGDLKAMAVEGQSMLGDAIDDGDIVIVNTRMTSLEPIVRNPTHIVAVRVLGGEFSLKRIALMGDQIKLIPSNPSYDPRLFPKDQVEILGVMVGLVRRF